MTSTLLQQHASQTAAAAAATATAAAAQAAANTAEAAAVAAATAATMAWSNEKLRFSCVDNIGIKQLWNLIALNSSNNNNSSNAKNHYHATKNDKNNKRNSIADIQQHQQAHFNSNNEKISFENSENFSHFLTNRDISPTNQMSLLKFLAINALELSAPATPALLEQQKKQNQATNNKIQKLSNQQQEIKPQIWMQLSGHPESIVPIASGIVRKRVTNSATDSEVLAYQQLSQELQTAKIVPHFYGALQNEGDHFIELQDLLAGFKDPCVMDIKMGCRTFLESEVTNTTLRPDLYKKMVTVDPNAPTAEEHQLQAITKLRYMLFREQMSSSHEKGFRIEALRMRGRPPVKDLKTVRSSDQIAQTIEQFLGGKKTVRKELVKRLKHMRSIVEKSQFFQRHEVVGSSIFIVYDDEKIGAWLIDFAKSRELPAELNVSHRADWVPGNREEGLLKGMDELINAFEGVCSSKNNNHNNGRKCLQI